MAQRKLDDEYKRKKYKDEYFNGKKTATDEYTGKRINRNNADVDHITPLDKVEKRYPGLSKEQHKQLANDKSNLAITNSSDNRSKQNLSNDEFLYRESQYGKRRDINTEINMYDKQNESLKAMDKQAKKMYSENFKENVKGLFKKRKK